MTPFQEQRLCRLNGPSELHPPEPETAHLDTSDQPEDVTYERTIDQFIERLYQWLHSLSPDMRQEIATQLEETSAVTLAPESDLPTLTTDTADQPQPVAASENPIDHSSYTPPVPPLPDRLPGLTRLEDIRLPQPEQPETDRQTLLEQAAVAVVQQYDQMLNLLADQEKGTMRDIVAMKIGLGFNRNELSSIEQDYYEPWMVLQQPDSLFLAANGAAGLNAQIQERIRGNYAYLESIGRARFGLRNARTRFMIEGLGNARSPAAVTILRAESGATFAKELQVATDQELTTITRLGTGLKLPDFNSLRQGMQAVFDRIDQAEQVARGIENTVVSLAGSIGRMQAGDLGEILSKLVTRAGILGGRSIGRTIFDQQQAISTDLQQLLQGAAGDIVEAIVRGRLNTIPLDRLQGAMQCLPAPWRKPICELIRTIFDQTSSRIGNVAGKEIMEAITAIARDL